MKNLRSLLLVSLILSVTLAACSDASKKDGVGPGPDEGTAQDIVIFENMVYSENNLDPKAVTSGTGEYYAPGVGYQLESSSLIDTSPKELTPVFSEPETALDISYLGTSKSGHTWFYNDYGLFRTSAKSINSNSECMLASQNMALGYIGVIGDNGLYKVDKNNVYGIIIDHNDVGNNYSLFILFKVMIDTSNEIGEISKTILLEYNSKTKSFNNILQNVNNSNYKISVTHNLENAQTLSYYLHNQINNELIALQYDPNTNKHYFLFQIPESEILFLNKTDSSKYTYLSDKNSKLTIKDCIIEKSSDQTDETRENVAKCLNGKLDELGLELYEIPIEPQDVTTIINSSSIIGELNNYTFEKTLMYPIKFSDILSFNKNDSNIRCNESLCYFSRHTELDDDQIGIYSFFIQHFYPTEKSLFLITNTPTSIKRLNYSTGNVSTLADDSSGWYVNLSAKTINGEDVLLYTLNQSSDNPVGIISTDYIYNTNSNSSQPLDKDLNFVHFKSFNNNTTLFKAGFTHNGKYLFLRESDNSATYYIDINEYIKEPNNKLLMRKAFSDTIEANLLFTWKDKAFWNTGAGTKTYINNPFSEDNKLQLFSNKYLSIIGAATIKTDAPSAFPGFSVAANVGAQLKCGAENLQALWCPSNQMCIEKETGHECINYSFSECTIHTDCNNAKKVCINQFCTSLECSTDSNCPVGSYCMEGSPHCILLANIDECKTDEQCAGNLKCQLDEDKGYSICKLEEDVAECSATQACPGELICSSTGKCLIKMPESTIFTLNEIPTVTSTGLNYKLNIEWTPPADKDGNPVTKYMVRVSYIGTSSIENELFQDIEDGKIEIKLFIDGAESSRTATVEICPYLEGVDIDLLMLHKKENTITLTNDSHCEIVPNGEGACPPILYNCTAKEDGTGYFCKYNSSILDWSLQNQQFEVKPDWLDNDYDIPQITPPQIPTPPIPNENEVPEEMEYQMNRYQRSLQDPRISPIPLKRNIDEKQIKRIKPDEPTE